jgi:hypothetical protein
LPQPVWLLFSQHQLALSELGQLSYRKRLKQQSAIRKSTATTLLERN